ncbi:MAG: hypothetical protein JNJ54_34270 [Myxococcaceae bacterium]|nr:hypothetical protein [Myxococcaceae bacterium]
MSRSVPVVLALALALGASQALAARLLLPEDVPAASPASPADAPSASSTAERRSPPSFGVHFGVTAAAGMVGAPIGLLLANLLGNLPISLIPTAILGLLPMGLVAPAFAALAGWLFGNWNLTEADGRFSFWAGFGAAALVHIIATVIAGFAGVSVAGIPGLILFSVIDGAAMGAAGVGAMRFFRKEPAPVTVLPSFAPSVSVTTFVPLSSVSF